MRQESFPPVYGAASKVLILGSMPGQASLQQQQYYAHPRNSFWRIICQLFGDSTGCSASAPYADRLQLVREHGVALWDVMRCCSREGSLDANIEESSIEANDFRSFFANNQAVRAVYFNGAKAEQSYQRYVIPTLSEQQAAIPAARLPSTSPAHAAMSYESKLAQWQSIQTKL